MNPTRINPRFVKNILLGAFAFITTYLFGVYAGPHLSIPQTIIDGPAMLFIAGTGWVVVILLSFARLKPPCDYLEKIFKLMAIGVIPLYAGIGFSFLSPSATFWAAWIGMAISSSYMLYQHIDITKQLKMGHNWTAQWFISLQSTAILWVLYF